MHMVMGSIKAIIIPSISVSNDNARDAIAVILKTPSLYCR